MPDLVLAKLNEWIKGLGPQESRIAVFEHIRDIPYAIIPELRDPYIGPSGLLSKNCGSCQPKHYLMGIMFGKLDIPVKYATFKFKWGDCSINYPPELEKIIPALPYAYHLAIKAYINNKWILVDATYDIPLSKAGFPVTENWDGKSDTKNAVAAEEEILHDSPQERVAYELAQRNKYSEKEKMLYSEFVDKLNLWLKRIRN